MASPEVIKMSDVAVPASHAPNRASVAAVNWTIAAGDYWVVTGLPGCGKSDLLMAAAALVKPLQGTQHLFGRDIAALSADDLAQDRLRVGIVFPDDGRPFQHLTVAENVALPLCYHRNVRPEETMASVSSILELTGVGAVANRMPGAIGHSLRQRMALARALVLKPEILFLDEPLRGADRREVRWWLDFLARLNQGHAGFGGRKMTLVVATNDLRTWMDQADKFGLINERQWRFLGDRDDLKGTNEPVVQELLADEFAKN